MLERLTEIGSIRRRKGHVFLDTSNSSSTLHPPPLLGNVILLCSQVDFIASTSASR